VKGLESWPSLADWAAAYDRLQVDQSPVAEAQWASFANWARLDPRFAEIYCARLARDWRGLAAARLNLALATQVWPAALGPLLEMITLTLERPHRAAFRLWAQSAMLGVETPHRGLYFVGTWSLGSRFAVQDAEGTLDIYARWGFLGREILVNKASAHLAFGHRTMRRAPERRRCLDALIAQGARRLTVSDYRAALQSTVSMRQAQLDLAAHPRLRAHGKTRARYFVVIRARAARRRLS
jgi:hypothetical protein